MFTFKINRKTHTTNTLAEVSAIYSAARDESGLGASRWPEAIVYSDGKAVGRVSYNGKIWPVGEWSVGMTPLFNPYE